MELKQLLESLTFPAVKGEILDMAASMDLDPDLLGKLHRIPDLEYCEDTDVTAELRNLGFES
ncbi:DUF2795 domain-containing protein [Streptomyces stramineus]|uniref:DUF2795 domain-containing protein n=1 Tax=Streptomyces stramineus TaxID=173861 RepID=A0ABP3KQY0_9ACTN